MIYRIARGKHRPDGCILPRLSDGTELFKFSFGEGCLYAPLDAEHDLNKLCGVSYGYLPRFIRPKSMIGSSWINKKLFKFTGRIVVPAHHWESLRLCWRPVGGKIEVWAYEYRKGVRRMTHLFDAAVGEEYFAVFREVMNRRALTIIDSPCKIADWVGCSPISKGYVLGPYFGGNKPAPHTMFLELERQ